MDIKALEQILDIKELNYAIVYRGGVAYRYITDIDNVVIWNALFYNLLKSLWRKKIAVSKNKIEECIREYRAHKVLINVQSDSIYLPPTLKYIHDLQYMEESRYFPSFFRGVAIGGLVTWILYQATSSLTARHNSVNPYLTSGSTA